MDQPIPSEPPRSTILGADGVLSSTVVDAQPIEGSESLRAGQSVAARSIGQQLQLFGSIAALEFGAVPLALLATKSIESSHSHTPAVVAALTTVMVAGAAGIRFCLKAPRDR